MRNRLPILLLGIFFASPFSVWSQCEIRGEVRDKRTGEPMMFANVFLDRTTFGAATDTRGQFHFSFPPGHYELKVSYVGYETETRLLNAGANEKVESNFDLAVSKEALNEVEVKGTRDKHWERLYRKFEREFIGTTKNARACTILNPWVVEFDEDEKGEWELKAYSNTPIEIHSKALGYKIHFLLKHFEFAGGRMTYIGDSRFEAQEPGSEEQLSTWTRNRATAYAGSERHLFRSIITGKMEQEGFRLYSETTANKELVRSANFSQELGKTVIPYSLSLMPVLGKTRTYRVPMDVRLEIHYTHNHGETFYRDTNDEVSWIESPQPFIQVTEMGIPLNPSELVMYGYLKVLRVGDMLPLDYQPGKLPVRK